VVAFRQGYPEISPRNKSFSAVKQQQSRLQAAMPTTEIHPAIAPQPADIVVTKRRVSAFSGSDLEVVLRTVFSSRAHVLQPTRTRQHHATEFLDLRWKG
jgi:nicotinamidase-related amidase